MIMLLIEELKNTDLTPVLAAPLAGYSDPPMASILSSMRVKHMIYPFVSSEGICRRKNYRNEVTLKLQTWKSFLPAGCVHIQIFGSNPETMAETAIYLENQVKANLIDLNMGCSVKKIWKAKSGSFLLKEPAKAIAIIEKVINSVRIPVTLKIRTGWSNSDENGLIVIREASKIGIAAVTLRG